MQTANCSFISGGRRSSAVRTFVILGTLVPAWHSVGVDFFNRVENEVLAAPTRFARSAVSHFPSIPMSFQATAYCDTGITKSGVPTRFGLVAADPAVLPLGTWIHVESPIYRGFFQVMDTGRLIKGKIIDIYLPDFGRAIQFGRQKVQVTVLKYGPMRRKPFISDN
jgi:3D (Asp-Asp-Asp) domain-containing protein